MNWVWSELYFVSGYYCFRCFKSSNQVSSFIRACDLCFSESRYLCPCLCLSVSLLFLPSLLLPSLSFPSLLFSSLPLPLLYYPATSVLCLFTGLLLWAFPCLLPDLPSLGKRSYSSSLSPAFDTWKLSRKDSRSRCFQRNLSLLFCPGPSFLHVAAMCTGLRPLGKNWQAIETLRVSSGL